MKNVFYIATKSQYDWNIFIPKKSVNAAEINASILLIQESVGIKNVPISQIFRLNPSGKEIKSVDDKELSYQSFLERIFSADMALVI